MVVWNGILKSTKLKHEYRGEEVQIRLVISRYRAMISESQEDPVRSSAIRAGVVEHITRTLPALTVNNASNLASELEGDVRSRRHAAKMSAAFYNMSATRTFCFTQNEHDDLMAAMHFLMQLWSQVEHPEIPESEAEGSIVRYVQVEREVLLLRAMLFLAHCEATLFPCEELRSVTNALENMSGIF